MLSRTLPVWVLRDGSQHLGCVSGAILRRSGSRGGHPLSKSVVQESLARLNARPDKTELTVHGSSLGSLGRGSMHSCQRPQTQTRLAWLFVPETTNGHQKYTHTLCPLPDAVNPDGDQIWKTFWLLVLVFNHNTLPSFVNSIYLI